MKVEVKLTSLLIFSLTLWASGASNPCNISVLAEGAKNIVITHPFDRRLLSRISISTPHRETLTISDPLKLYHGLINVISYDNDTDVFCALSTMIKNPQSVRRPKDVASLHALDREIKMEAKYNKGLKLSFDVNAPLRRVRNTVLVKTPVELRVQGGNAVVSVSEFFVTKELQHRWGGSVDRLVRDGRLSDGDVLVFLGGFFNDQQTLLRTEGIVHTDCHLGNFLYNITMDGSLQFIWTDFGSSTDLNDDPKTLTTPSANSQFITTTGHTMDSLRRCSRSHNIQLAIDDVMETIQQGVKKHQDLNKILSSASSVLMNRTLSIMKTNKQLSEELIRRMGSPLIFHRVEQMQQEIDELKDDIAQLNDDIAQLKEEGLKKDLEISQLNDDIAQLKEEGLKKDLEISQLKEEGLKKDLKIAQLNDEIVELKQTIQALDLKVEALTSFIWQLCSAAVFILFSLGVSKLLGFV